MTNRNTIYLWKAIFLVLLCILSTGFTAFSTPSFLAETSAEFQQQEDTSQLKYKYKDVQEFPPTGIEPSKGLFLPLPPNVKSSIEYNPVTKRYEFKQTVGSFPYRPSSSLSLDDYRQFDLKQSVRDYWRQKAAAETMSKTGFKPSFSVGGEAFDKIFGSNTINIVPQGSAELIFGYNMSRVDNPQLSEKLRRTPSFVFDEKIQMNVNGSIGDKLQLGVSYNTEATFEFENKTKLGFEGQEDDIVKKVEAGNVSLPLNGSLITGSQSLFGLKVEMQFGKLTVTSIASQQKGETSVIETQGGAQTNEFKISADQYEANRHFFLSHEFRDNYDKALSNLPVINSPINITRIEVWVTNKSNVLDNARNIVAFTDLGEVKSAVINPYWHVTPGVEYPSNAGNNLYETMTTSFNIRSINNVANQLGTLQSSKFYQGQDYEKIENARLLSDREYTVNDRLGYISLNTPLNSDEILAVAYEYTAGGVTYRVGELSTDGITAPNALVLKLLKGTNLSPRARNWNLMMKNIYSIGAYQLSPDDFQLNILYQDDKTGNAVNYLSEGAVKKQILLKVLNLDQLNSQHDPQPDGRFDFIEGITINSTTGRIMFPVLEPFGSYLKGKINNDYVAGKYVYQELYDSTQTKARQVAEKDKFWLQGRYQSSSSSEISLNAMNVPQGSVTVTAGSQKLLENVDYTVDYALGRVRILNQGLLQSGMPIKISLENQSMFSVQSKTLFGTHLNYKFSDNFNLGATMLHLTERPLTQKVNIGDEPISNTIWGFDGRYTTQSRFLTKMIDALPFIQTKEISTIAVDGEFAQLLPGSARAIGKSGTSYIDDFEGSQTSIELKTFSAWSLASIPQGQPDLFPESSLVNDRRLGYNRAKLAWYVIDPLFNRNTSLTPSYLTANDKSSHFVREVFEKEIWPNKESPNNLPTNIPVLNLAFYPDEKGPYNYDAAPDLFSAGITDSGKLNNPASRWGGIMREISSTDFEANNVEYIEFWLMNPFVEQDSTHTGGDLYFNLGDESEDVLRDGRKAFENGLPGPSADGGVDTTNWGLVPNKQQITQGFDLDIATRQAQDVGLDGLSDKNERSFFKTYLDTLALLYGTNSVAYQEAETDPSGDDYKYYRNPDYDNQQASILDRYKQYNGLEGNSPVSDASGNTGNSPLPNSEDINRDNTLSESENYYQYKVSIRPQDLVVGKNFVTDKVTTTVTLENGKNSVISWYQFKVPISEPQKVVGSIQDFKSIRFMRMFMKGFRQRAILRFAALQLIRGEWRKYTSPLLQGSESSADVPDDGSFEISAVNIEENSKRSPVNYVLPPGFNRVIDPSSPQLRQLNEQSMALKVKNLADGDARAAFKNVELDVRQYGRIRMEVHGEAVQGNALKDGDLTVFIRLGTDYKNNYYEYEVPLHLTAPGNYSNDNDHDRQLVWPSSNSFDIDLTVLEHAKLTRNDLINKPGSNVSMLTRFPVMDGENRVYVCGNPNLSNVRTIMIGVRNPNEVDNSFANDGAAKTAEVWVDELRVTNFNDKSGWAANARATAKLADLGTISLAGSAITPGFGSIDKKVNERAKEYTYSYDLATSLELGKFFPDKLGVHLPMFFGLSETFIRPEYDQRDPDILLTDALNHAGNDSARQAILKGSQNYMRRRSLNFTNIKIGKPGNKPKFYDPSNWTASYSFNDLYTYNITTEYDIQRHYRAALGYNYSMRPKNISPFQKVKFLRSPYLALIRDFNFYLLPSNFSFRTEMIRDYEQEKARNLDNPFLRIDSTVMKNFVWNRYYDLKFDITRSLKLDFSATNIARIDEPPGAVDRSYKDQYQLWKDSVMRNIRSFGRTTNYHHIINIQYNVPLSKIPLLNWVSLSARYSTTFNWEAGPLIDTIDLGNTIDNSRRMDFTGRLNLLNFYNKVGYLKQINEQDKAPKQNQNKQKEYKTVTYENTYVLVKANVARTVIHNLNTDDIKVKVYDEANKEVKATIDNVNANKVRFTIDHDINKVRVVVEGKVEKKPNLVILILNKTLRILMGVRDLSITFSQIDGTKLPGYKPKTKFFGLESFNRMLAPGIPFILGSQDTSFGARAGSWGWLTKDPRLSSPFLMASNVTVNVRSTIEPLPGLKIDVSAMRGFTQNASLYYQYDPVTGTFNFSTGRMVTGNYSITVISWKTAFDKIRPGNQYKSKAFNNFSLYRKAISARLASQFIGMRRPGSPSYISQNIEDPGTTDANGYHYGYGATSQQVLISSFFAAYTGTSADKAPLNAFPSLLYMMPSWKLNYDGIGNLDFLKKYVRSINISHAYRSTYNVAAYSNNLLYDPNSLDGLSYVQDVQKNFIPQYELNSVSINEMFSPLIGVDLGFQNSLTTRFTINKTRTVSLSLSNNQVIEMQNNEVIVGAGYRFNQVALVINAGNGPKQFKSDLNLRADFSLRDSRTVLHKLVEQDNSPSAGQQNVSIKVSAEYKLGPSFNLRLFFDRMMNNPFVSTSYKTANTNVGFSVTFQLVQ